MGSKLFDQLQEDIKTAMKAKQADQVTALRMLVSAVKDVTVNAGKDVTDEAVVTVIGKAIKQRSDSVEQFRNGGRNDLADKEQMEIDLFKKYQPAQLSDEEIEALAKKAIEEVGATGKADMGKVMGALMPQVKGRADGKAVNRIVGGLLG